MTYDYAEAWSDLRNDPGTFLENTGRDLASVAFGGAFPAGQSVLQQAS